jgi:hypothetical protein
MLQALTGPQMIFFSALMMWAFSPAEYHVPGERRTWNILRPLWDSVNYTDFAIEIFGSLKFFIDYARGKPHTHAPRVTPGPDGRKVDFGEAFRVEGAERRLPGGSADGENVRLEPYPPAQPGSSLLNNSSSSSSEFEQPRRAQTRRPL